MNGFSIMYTLCCNHDLYISNQTINDRIFHGSFFFSVHNNVVYLDLITQNVTLYSSLTLKTYAVNTNIANSLEETFV